MAESPQDRRRDDDEILDPAANDPIDDEQRERDELASELDEVARQTDDVQGFQLHQPTRDELDDDDGYLPEAEHGRHLEQEPSEADVEVRERQLDRQQIEREDD
jgi:hypothetical protein